LEAIPEDISPDLPTAQPSPRVNPPSEGMPSSSANPEHGSGAMQAGTSAAGGAHPPLRFTCRGSDGTLYQVDSQEDEILFQKLKENVLQFSQLIEVSI